MKKTILICTFFLIGLGVVRAQNTGIAQPGSAAPDQAAVAKIYNPAADAHADIKAALGKATAERKHVILQVGGNWCVWCLRFAKQVSEDPQLDSALKADYVIYHLNYSKENKNEDLLAEYGYPQRFGFPVFVVLDAKGNRIHTQNSAYLEQDKGYSKEKILEFFKGWRPAALDSKNYTD